MAENALTKVARIAAGSAMGAILKDKDGNDKIVKPDGDANYLDLRDIVAGGSGTGGGDNPDHPSAGVDYYAGSLTDGEITERYLLYQRDKSVTEDPTTPKTVTLLRDVGSKFNMAGDGATLLLHLQKTVMTAGAKGAVSDVNLNYDTNNAAKEGYFTTTSVYPVYIKSADLATTNELDIPIDGIGEKLSGKNFLAPHLKVKFNGDGTMTYYSVTGYDNDGNTAGATGANYDVVVDVIATFSTQEAVAQLPASVNLFVGDSNENIILSGLSNFYEDSMDGLEFSLDDFAYFHGSTLGILPSNSHGIRADITKLNIGKIRIPKQDLIIGNKIDLGLIRNSTNLDITYRVSSNSNTWISSTKASGTGNYIYSFKKFSDCYIQIMADLTVNVVIQFNVDADYKGALRGSTTSPFVANVNKVATYKD